MFDPYLYAPNPLGIFWIFAVGYIGVFAFWALSHYPKSRINQAFFLMGSVVGIWCLGTGFMLCSNEALVAEAWYRVAYIGVSFIPPSVLLFASSLASRMQKDRRWIRGGFLLAALFACEGIWGDWFIVGMYHYKWGWYPRYGAPALILLSFFGLYLFLSFRALQRRARGLGRTGAHRRQVRTVLLAFSIAYLAILDFLPAVGVWFYPVGFVPIVVFVSLVWWIVDRYQLFNPISTSLAKRVLGTIADAIITVDGRGFVRMVNPRVEELLGYSREELFDRPISSILDDGGTAVVMSFLQEASPSLMSRQGISMQLQAKDGTVIPSACTLSIIPSRTGRHRQGAVLACRDMRDRIRQQEELIRSEKRFRSLIENASDMIMIVDERGILRYTSPSVDRILGYQPDALLGRPMSEFIHETDLRRVMKGFDRLAQGDRTLEVLEYRFRHQDGVWFFIESMGKNLLGDPVVEGVVFNCRDITERKMVEVELQRHREHLEETVARRTGQLQRLNEELEQDVRMRMQAEEEVRELNEQLEERVQKRTADLERAYADLRELDKLKDDFLSTVSHEFRTPLASIRAYSEILASYDDMDTTTLGEFAGIINAESERLTRMINNVLDLTRIESGRMPWDDEVMSLEEIIRNAVRAQNRLLEESALKVTTELPPDLPVVFADRDKIQQVITNLIGNAAKFSSPGGHIRIEARAVSNTATDAGSGWIQVRVQDQGIGIAEEFHQVIFDRFRQIHSDTVKEKTRGSGLGLPICKEIVSRYGGEIWVESEEGKGSTFIFTLPGMHTEQPALSPE